MGEVEILGSKVADVLRLSLLRDLVAEDSLKVVMVGVEDILSELNRKGFFGNVEVLSGSVLNELAFDILILAVRVNERFSRRGILGKVEFGGSHEILSGLGACDVLIHAVCEILNDLSAVILFRVVAT